jgi:hypothetical protein
VEFWSDSFILQHKNRILLTSINTTPERAFPEQNYRQMHRFYIARKSTRDADVAFSKTSMCLRKAGCRYQEQVIRSCRVLENTATKYTTLLLKCPRRSCWHHERRPAYKRRSYTTRVCHGLLRSTATLMQRGCPSQKKAPVQKTRCTQSITNAHQGPLWSLSTAQTSR